MSLRPTETCIFSSFFSVCAVNAERCVFAQLYSVLTGPWQSHGGPERLIPDLLAPKLKPFDTLANTPAAFTNALGKPKPDQREETVCGRTHSEHIRLA